MTTITVNKFDGVSSSNLGFSLNKNFSPELDLRTVDFWDFTDSASVVTESVTEDAIPRIKTVKGKLGKVLTGRSNLGRPCAVDAAGKKGAVWRSDSVNTAGYRSLIFPTGLLPNTKEVLIGFIFGEMAGVPVASLTGNFIGFSSDGTVSTANNISFANFTNGTLPVILANSFASSGPLSGEIPLDGGLHCCLIHFDKSGNANIRIDGVMKGSKPAKTLGALMPMGGTGSIGGGSTGSEIGLGPAVTLRMTHLAIAELGKIDAKSTQNYIERDRNAAEYWEASLMYAAGIESKLPVGHTFKISAPITTWVGERT